MSTKPSTINASTLIEQLTEAGRWISQRNWVPATGGNFSARLDKNTCLVTASGKHKGHLKDEDLLHIEWQKNHLTCAGKPSAETLLHTRIYDLSDDAAVVFHTHSVQSTVFSRIIKEPAYPFTGYEMQKAIHGQSSHLHTLNLPILDNDQDMVLLAQALEKQWSTAQTAFAFLVRGHGMYVWGKDTDSATRHLEGWEFLLECELERLKFLSLNTLTSSEGKCCD